MELTQTTMGTFDELLLKARNGDRISLYQGAYTQLSSHPQGVIVETTTPHMLLLNGEFPLWDGAFDEWQSWKDTFFIRLGDRILENGKKEVYRGPITSWTPYPQGGVVVAIEGQLLLNGTEELYNGDCEWVPHPQGIVVMKGDPSRSQFFLNGNQKMFEGPCESWDACQRGILTKLGEQVFLNGQTELCNEVGEDWEVHPYGVITVTRGKIVLHVHKGLWDTDSE